MSAWTERGFATRDVRRIRAGILRFLARYNPEETALIRCGDLSLEVYPDGDQGHVAWWLSPDEEAPIGVRKAWEECTTSYRHADGSLEVYI